MVNYELGKIYRIDCNVTGLVYVGSTCEPILSRRLAGHVGHYKSYLNGKDNFVSSYKVLENGDYTITLIEKCACESIDELLYRERYHTNAIECVNKIKGQGLLNKLGQREYDKKYYVDNAKQIATYKKQYYVENKEQIIEKSKKYYVENKEQTKEHNKKYYVDNKAKILEKNICHCGGKYTTCNKAQHNRSKMHIKYIKLLVDVKVE